MRFPVQIVGIPSGEFSVFLFLSILFLNLCAIYLTRAAACLSDMSFFFPSMFLHSRRNAVYNVFLLLDCCCRWLFFFFFHPPSFCLSLSNCQFQLSALYGKMSKTGLHN